MTTCQVEVGQGMARFLSPRARAYIALSALLFGCGGRFDPGEPAPEPLGAASSDGAAGAAGSGPVAESCESGDRDRVGVVVEGDEPTSGDCPRMATRKGDAPRWCCFPP